MNKRLIAAITMALMGLTTAGLLYAQAIYDTTTFHAFGRQNQPAPVGHVVGKDNGPGDGYHNTGVDCAICHTTNGKAGNYVFSMSGTIYEDRAATRPLAGAEVILQDYSGKVISMTTNEVGNFWTYEPISSHPYSVASKTTTEDLFTVSGDGTALVAANSSDSRTWIYKAWVRNPDGAVRSMVTIAPVGGGNGTTPRMSCNMHHSPFGSTGAAWASRQNTLPVYPASNLSFKRHILPIFAAKCAPCHVPGTKTTRLVTISDRYTSTTVLTPYPLLNPNPLTNTTVTQIDYSKNLDLTAYAGSGTKNGIDDFVAGSVCRSDPNDSMSALVSCAGSPDNSLLLFKTKISSVGDTMHGGGTFWSESDADYQAIRQWIVEGAQDN